jgi:endoglucanase
MGDEPFRLNIDILGHKPTVATIMLGMNDVGRNDYGEGKTGPDFETRRKASLDRYDANMQKLIAALQKSGARVILITPSIYDETTKLEKANPDVGVGRNGALGQCAEKIHGWSQQYHTGLVKFWEEMNSINQREQAKNPAFTIVGPDRVHPGPVGHFVMGYTLLKAQGMPREVAHIGIDAKQGKASNAANCEVENVKTGAGGVEFDCLEKALPMVVPDEARAALALVPFEQELNQEPLSVTGLAGGKYNVKIDDQPIGQFTAAELQTGVNLANNAKTPQYQQSAAATKINADRTRAGGTLRGIAAQYYGLSRAKVNVNDRAAVQKKLHEQAEAAKAAGKPVDPRMEALFNDPNEPAKTEKQYEDLSAALAKACQPRKHHFSISKE